MRMSGDNEDQMSEFLPSLTKIFSDFFSFHLLLIWVLTLVFCWKVFPAIFTSNGSSALSSKSTGKKISRSSPSKSRSPSNIKAPPSRSLSPPPPSSSADCFPPQNPEICKQSVSSTKKLISELQLEACSKAKEAGKHPSYTSLVLSLVHHYNLDVNKLVLSNSFSIFHCSCLSGSLELVSSLSPLANINSITNYGDSPLYLAVYAAARSTRRGANNGQAGVEVVRHLLQAGSQVNMSNLAGFTALHQASRLSSPQLVRLLLDWGGNPQAWAMDRSVEGTRSMSVMSKNTSVVTRSVTNKVNEVLGNEVNQSVMLR